MHISLFDLFIELNISPEDNDIRYNSFEDNNP